MSLWHIFHFITTCPYDIRAPLLAEGTLRFLTSWREVGISIRIPFSNLAITAVNEQFGLLIYGNLTSRCNCVRLSVEYWSYSCITFASNTPSPFSWNYMLVLSAHLHLLSAYSFDKHVTTLLLRSKNSTKANFRIFHIEIRHISNIYMPIGHICTYLTEIFVCATGIFITFASKYILNIY